MASIIIRLLSMQNFSQPLFIIIQTLNFIKAITIFISYKIKLPKLITFMLLGKDLQKKSNQKNQTKLHPQHAPCPFPYFPSIPQIF